MSQVTVIPHLDHTRYERHALHGSSSIWPEKNCYLDLWLELLHALKLEPMAMLPFTLTVDFEGDQWTFFKPSHDELRELYGIEVQELTVWRPLIEHAIEHLSGGKLISTEADAFWLPDTSGTDYRTKHSKTTILLNDLDLTQQRLGYFHNAGYYQLQGEDFIKTFRLDAAPDPTFLPLFAEFIRIDRLIHRDAGDLAQRSLVLLAKYLQRLPIKNPTEQFAQRFAEDLPQLQANGLDHYHAWAFAATRQLGAAFELIAAHLRWLSAHTALDAATSIAHFENLSMSAKTFILQGARAVMSKRPLNAEQLFEPMHHAWSEGTTHLKKAVHSVA